MVNLKDFIHPEMDLLFVALNAPEVSNANAHWFSYNLSFWNLLRRSGIITHSIDDPLAGDITVFGSTKFNYSNWCIGVTDLNKEIVAASSRHVSTTSAQVQRITAILDKHPTKRMCLMHSKVADEFEQQRMIVRNYKAGKNDYGLVGKYKRTSIYEVPFHSNAIPDKHLYYSKLIQ